jgi:hypothetical protein
MEVGLMWAPCRVWRGSLKGDASATGLGADCGHTAARTDGMSAAAYRGIDLRVSMIEFKTS